MKANTLILVILFFSPCRLWAQGSVEDSLRTADTTTEFHVKQLILPASLAAVGTFGCFSSWGKSVSRDVRDNVAEWRNGHYVRIDDYIQYLPVVSNLGLSLLGAKAKHGYLERVMLTATAYAAMGIMVNAVKWTVDEQRPDSPALNSFPSGHTATAFMGAELVRMEYKDASPLYGIGAYTVACGVAFLRVYNERHWCGDVLTGAGIGILSTRIAYWLLPVERKLLGLDRRKQRLDLAIVPSYNYATRGYGAAVTVRF